MVRNRPTQKASNGPGGFQKTGADHAQIVEFLENYRQLMDERHRQPMKLISIKMPIPLLEAFKLKAKMCDGRPYQTIIKDLMHRWLETAD